MQQMSYPNEIKQIWEMVKESFRAECSSTAFDLWYGSIEPSDFHPEKNELVFPVESEFKHKTLSERYKPIIEARFAEVAGMDVTVSFLLTGKTITPEDILGRFKSEPKPEPKVEGIDGKNPYAKYTFDSFIEGESNRFARAVCFQVANNPYSVYNPLFIYGPSGVGKTHLMFAVINEIRRVSPDTKVIYTKGDDFINYMVECLLRNDMTSFRDRYRKCDVLLIDDIQFIAGKESTQNEVFHTFQALFDEGKQIILASDRPPKDINPLEERLRSRFEQGLMADINPPNLDLRVAIIKRRTEEIGADIPNEVLYYLAENLRSNIRQIEGAINKLVAKSMIQGRQISMELARDCIGDLLGDAEPVEVTIDKIFAAIYQKYNVTKDALIGPKRTREIVQARHIAIYLVHEITEFSYKRVGTIFGRDHSTAMASIDIIKSRLIKDPIFAADLEALKKDILDK